MTERLSPVTPRRFARSLIWRGLLARNIKNIKLGKLLACLQAFSWTYRFPVAGNQHNCALDNSAAENAVKLGKSRFIPMLARGGNFPKACAGRRRTALRPKGFWRGQRQPKYPPAWCSIHRRKDIDRSILGLGIRDFTNIKQILIFVPLHFTVFKVLFFLSQSAAPLRHRTA